MPNGGGRTRLASRHSLIRKRRGREPGATLRTCLLVTEDERSRLFGLALLQTGIDGPAVGAAVQIVDVTIFRATTRTTTGHRMNVEVARRGLLRARRQSGAEKRRADEQVQSQGASNSSKTGPRIAVRACRHRLHHSCLCPPSSSPPSTRRPVQLKPQTRMVRPTLRVLLLQMLHRSTTNVRSHRLFRRNDDSMIAASCAPRTDLALTRELRSARAWHSRPGLCGPPPVRARARAARG
jgi:hypothetical protein